MTVTSLAWLLGAICLLLASSLTLVSSGPNLRVQTNSENPANNAPYLLKPLDAFPQKNSSSEADQQVSAKQNGSINLSNQSTGSRPSPLAANRSSEEDHAGDSDENEPHHFSVIKEETVEEIVDLEPESAPLRLATENNAAGQSAPPKDYSATAELVPADTSRSVSTVEPEVGGNPEKGAKVERKPQLPVTSSHLKRPALGLLDEDEAASGEQQASAAANDTGSGGKSGGAKSLVSPSVAADVESDKPSASAMKKRLPMVQQDTLSPDQIMHGVTNVSNVPAIVSKEYGHQTRTRITLGGGYVRDRQPPLTKPGSSSLSADQRPEKPVTPLEKPKLGGQSSVVPVEVSRVIEVPERIVLKPSVQKLDESAATVKLTELAPSNETSINKNALGSPDPRCPKSGVRTFGHATACDRYYYCEDGYASEQVCPNGLMYGTREPVKDFCVHRWKADCEDKTIPNPVSSPGCRWQYGIFNVQGSPKCSPDFYECSAGRFEVKKCSIEGQVYDDRTKSCQFAEQVGCAKAVLADFQCPPDDQANTYWPFPRYFFNERALIHCVNDKPEIIRCTEDQRVDPEHLHCIPLAKWNQQHATTASLDARKSREKKKASQ